MGWAGVITKRRAVAGFVAGILTVSWPAALARQTSKANGVPGAQVGFWAGETTTHCAATDPNFCPRDTRNYAPAVWDVLSTTHAALYMNFVYQADFGPAPSGVR